MKKKAVESKKMNPIWVVLVFAILVIVIIFKTGVFTKIEDYKIESIYQAHSNDIDVAIQELLNHPGFSVQSQSKQVSEMGKLLAIYEQVGIISDLYYSGDNYMYTFTYTQEPIAGALGGVSLKEWNPYMN